MLLCPIPTTQTTSPWKIFLLMFLSLVRLRGYEELYVRHVLSKVLLFQASPFLLSSFSSPSWNQLLSCLPPFNISKYYIFIPFVLIFVQSICWVSFYMHPNLVCWLPIWELWNLVVVFMLNYLRFIIQQERYLAMRLTSN